MIAVRVKINSFFFISNLFYIMAYNKYISPQSRAYFKVFAQIVRRSFNNECAECGIKHGAIVTRKPSGEYIECDEFEANFFKKTDHRVFKLFLHVRPINPSCNDLELENYTCLCPYHSRLLELSQLDRQKKNLKGEFKNISIDIIKEVKNFIHASTGKRLTTRDTVYLLLHITKSLNIQTDL